MHHHDEPEHQSSTLDLDAAIRQLAQRRPRLASSQLPSRLLPRLRAPVSTLLRAAAVLVTLGGALASWWSWPLPGSAANPTHPPPQSTVLTIPLEDGTPLYFVLSNS